MMLGQACEQLGEVDVALDALVTATRLSDGNSKPVALRGYILATMGTTAAAREVLSHARGLSPASATCRRSRWRWCTPGSAKTSGSSTASIGAYAVRDVHLAFLTVDTKWDRYRSEPEFAALLARCAFERESQAGVNS